MEGKGRYIFFILQSGMMALFMTAIITLVNLGPTPDFFARWAMAFLIAWPLAFLAAFFSAPQARRATLYLLSRFGGNHS